MNANQKIATLIGLYFALVVLLAALIMVALPATPLLVATPSAVAAALLICGMAASFSTRPAGGPAAARTFFTRSVNRNSRAVVVITSELDLREIMIRLKAAGLQPMVATV